VTPTLPDPMLALLRGEPVNWATFGMTPAAFLAVCDREELRGLVHACLGRAPVRQDWPEALRADLAQVVRGETAQELVRGAEIRSTLEALTQAGVRPVLLKGTPIAYTLYATPAARPRADTDLLIRSEDVPAARAALASCGYEATVHCNDLFSQFEVQKRDQFGLVHVFDVHWKISTQPVFADALTYEEALARAVPVPALGLSAMAAGQVDALLLACIHPVMHHQNAARPLWMYDVHLLASSLTTLEWDTFVRDARRKKVTAVCVHGLRLAEAAFRTPLPDGLIDALASAGGNEPSAEYLASQRRWADELMSSVRGLPRLGDRARWMREVLFPRPQYMLGAYGLRGKPLGVWLLPALYAHRNLRGVWKILSGKK